MVEKYKCHGNIIPKLINNSSTKNKRNYCLRSTLRLKESTGNWEIFPSTRTLKNEVQK